MKFVSIPDPANSAESMVEHIDFDIVRDRMIRRTEIAKLLKVSTQTVKRWVDTGKFPPPVYVGGMQRWIVRHINEWFAKQTKKEE
jgi:predicted DNA-binding transcriptional regulator AlpA